MSEGPFTRVGAVAGVAAVIIAYFGLAYSAHLWPITKAGGASLHHGLGAPTSGTSPAATHSSSPSKYRHHTTTPTSQSTGPAQGNSVTSAPAHPLHHHPAGSTAEPSPTATAAAPTTETYDVTCSNPVTLDIGAYSQNGVVTISVTGAVNVTGPTGQTTLTVSGPAGNYDISATANPGGGAQGVWLNSEDPADSCYTTS